MKPLDLLLLSAEYIENKEGVVITFSNGKMAKQKHQHYMLLHGILADGLKEHILISKILNEEIDDLLSFIPAENIEERLFIDEMTQIVVRDINHRASLVFNKFNDKDRKSVV